ncbi:serine/threonine-protein phosphatase 6 regulatory subunit 2-like [Anguilla anguilla]|uniref:serine/threonine-protein phosphatase 6 regulatory subunit 2-like n=1 Tax=Anguilla anguilla TaxID=7936 RepID=UPI0015AB8C58|nr:serine/threonine-protein phosphatase 6 regulatory subunit 2-like [Anguilla anguilla]
MFWKFDLHTTSHIDKLLDKEDVTLQELMEEEDVLQECKAQNRRLLLFLSQDHCMQELVTLITREPPEDMEEKIRFKYPNIACELLTSDVNHINDKLGGDESLLETLYGFLEQQPPLNPLLASFFSKTIGNLIARKTEQVITFLRKKEGFIGLVLKHIDTSAMMDLLLRLISCVEPAPLRQEVLAWLNEEKLVQRLVGLIHTGQDEERQSNASQTLCDIIRLSRDQATQLQESMEPDPLLAVLESQESVEQLLKNMFPEEKSEACIVNGTQVLLTLLETRRPGLEGLMDLCSQGYERSYTVNSSILQGIQPHLKDFHQLLLQPPKKAAMLTTIGVLEEPLGNSRLHVARMVASLLQASTPSVSQELCRLDTVDLLLDLFFKYTWNNFLHLQVELCVAAILNHASQEEKAMGTLGQEQGVVQGQDQGKGPEQGKGEGEGQKQEQDKGQKQGQGQEQDKGQEHGQKQGQEQGQVQEQGKGEGEGQGQKHGQEQEQGQGEGGASQMTGPDTPDASGHNVLIAHLFQKCRLVQRILDAWEENDKIQAEGGMRRGNMGHLTRIANAVVQNMEKGPVQAQIADLIKELPEDCRGRWESFVDETLTETNRRNTVDLVSSHHLHSSSEDDDMEGPFPNELSLQQAFSDYQIQQMTANFVDQFGFNDEEFAEHDDNINATFDRIAEINFSLDADDDSANSAVFEACCKERIQQFDDNEEEEDIWEEKEINYATQVRSRTRFGVSRTSEGSSRTDMENGERGRGAGSGEEEAESKESSTHTENSKNASQTEAKEADSTGSPGWTASFEDAVNSKAPAPGAAAVDVGAGLWDSASPQRDSAHIEDKGWAKFTDFQPFCCSESGPRCSSPVDSESTDSEGRPKQSQDKSLKGSSPCAWNVCVARKAPLVASDSSSSGGSDSEEDEEDKADIVTETITTGAGKETIKLTMDAKNEKAVFTSRPDTHRVFRPADRGEEAETALMAKLSIADGPQKGAELPEKTEAAGDPLNATATASPATDLTVTDKKEEAPSPVEPTLNGPA